MEKAVLKTLIYADIFDYPLTVYEIHKWLIGRKAKLRQVELGLGRLVQSAKCKVLASRSGQSGYFCLSKKDILAGKRKRRGKQSAIYLRKAKMLAHILKIIPWIKLVGVSGGLAMDNAERKDDIDLILITAKNRLWLSRFLALGLISLTGQRRKAGEKGRKIAGKLCLNILLEEDRLGQYSKDIYLAHEVLQMKVLWQRDGIYSEYLADNDWALKFLPNWITSHDLRFMNSDLRIKNHKSLIVNHKSIMSRIELLVRRFQLWYMKPPKGMERIEDGALYFHPQDCRPKVLSEYRHRLKKIISP